MPAGATYEPIATATVSSPTFPITFTSIPGTYTDLRLILTGAGDGGGLTVRYTLNNDTSFIYSYTNMYGNGTSYNSARAAGNSRWESSIVDLPQSTAGFGLFIMDLFNYAGSTNKVCLVTQSADGGSFQNVLRQVGLYPSTTAITRIDLSANRNYATGTTATLYGIKAA
jgi:hypothetical protein